MLAAAGTCLAQQSPGAGQSPMNATVMGIGHGPDEKASKANAERDAVRIAVQNLLGPQAPQNQQDIDRFIEKAEPKQFLKAANGAKSIVSRKQGNETVTEASYAVDWAKLRPLLEKAGFTIGNSPGGMAQGQPGQPGGMAGLPETIVGMGKDKDEKKAISLAQRDAVRIAANQALGPQSPMNAGAIDAFIAQADPAQFLLPAGNPPYRVRKEGTATIAEYPARVTWEILRNQLIQAGLSPIPATAGQQGPFSQQNQQGQQAQSAGIADKGAADWGAVTETEKNTILKYLDTLSFMVYYNENSLADPQMLKAAVSRANTVLTRAGITVFDINRVEKIKTDQRKVYEGSSGTSVDFIQWVAQKLNADIYVQIDVITGKTSGEAAAASPSDAAQTVGVLTTELFDASTGQLLGSVSSNIVGAAGAGVQDTSSLVLNVVSQAMVQAVSQAKEQMQKALVRGMRYELIVQNTPDSKLMNSFLQELKSKTKQIKVLSSSPTEYRYEVYYIGLLSDLEALIYSVSEKIVQLKDINQVMASGKSLTMDTGLK
jgi:hypothetical protein